MSKQSRRGARRLDRWRAVLSGRVARIARSPLGASAGTRGDEWTRADDGVDAVSGDEKRAARRSARLGRHEKQPPPPRLVRGAPSHLSHCARHSPRCRTPRCTCTARLRSRASCARSRACSRMRGWPRARTAPPPRRRCAITTCSARRSTRGPTPPRTTPPRWTSTSSTWRAWRCRTRASTPRWPRAGCSSRRAWSAAPVGSWRRSGDGARRSENSPTAPTATETRRPPRAPPYERSRR